MEFKLGQTVYHKQFGKGTVVGFEENRSLERTTKSGTVVDNDLPDFVVVNFEKVRLWNPKGKKNIYGSETKKFFTDTEFLFDKPVKKEKIDDTERMKKDRKAREERRQQYVIKNNGTEGL